MDKKNAKNKALKGFFWSSLDRGGDQALRFLISLVLARLLLPEMFGLIAMINVIFEASQLISDGGFGIALINKKDHTRNDECSVFLFNVTMSVICCVIIYFAAPYMALFYKKPELTPIIRLLSLTFFISSFGAVQNVLLMKTMDFKRQALISIATTIVSGGMGIGFALAGFGIWSLVIQLIARSLVGSILLWSLYSWRPALMFDFKSLSGLFSYGSRFFLSNISSILFNNLHNIIIGKVYDANALAYFSRGRQLQQLPSDGIWAAIGRVAFPAFSLLKDDVSTLVSAYKKALTLLAFFMLPMMLIMSACSKNLVLCLYTAKWLDCAVYFKIFCLFGAFMVMDNLTISAVLGSGKSGYASFMNVFQKILLLASVFLSVRFGILWMAISYSLTVGIGFAVDYFIYCRIFKQSIIHEVGLLVPYALFGMISYFVCIFVGLFDFSLFFNLILQLSAGAMVYLLLNIIFKTKGIFEVMDIFKQICPPLPHGNGLKGWGARLARVK